MKYSFTVLGTGSALPTVNRHPSAYLLNANGRFFLLDCGEGTQMQLRKYGIKIQKIEKIFITHLHGDHYFGLIGLLNTFQLLGREKKLEIYCPKGLKAIIEQQLTASDGWLEFPYQFIEWENDAWESIYSDHEICIEKFPLKHRIICCGYNLILQKSVRNINIEAVQKYQIPGVELGAIQKGADYKLPSGELIPNDTLTHPFPNPVKISYCSDTAFTETIVPYVENADILFHESTFLEKDILKAQKTNHSTAIQAATIAKKAQVKKLIIGHFSARYIHLDVFEKEARSIFENTYIALEGETYE